MSVAGWRIVLLLVFAALFYGSLAKADTRRVSTITAIVQGDPDAFDMDRYMDEGAGYACSEKYSAELTTLCEKRAAFCAGFKANNEKHPALASKYSAKLKAITPNQKGLNWSVVDHCNLD